MNEIIGKIGFLKKQIEESGEDVEACSYWSDDGGLVGC